MAVNIGIVYFSGIYFNPVVIEHMSGSAKIIMNNTTFLIFGFFVLLNTIFFILLRRIISIYKKIAFIHVRYQYFIIIILFFVLSHNIWLRTPEFLVAKSFYEKRFAKAQKDISPQILEKLKRFGMNYNLNSPQVNLRPNVFFEPKKLLPESLRKNYPNIVIITWESLSSRLVDLFDTQFTNMIPGIDTFIADKNTTVFKNYYNSSSPTVTGLLSTLCSFLPPLGHKEIKQQEDFHRMNLSCLPKILRQNGYAKAVYITAVEKDFANKDTILANAGMDKSYGTKELKKILKEPPLSWGYSDHQMFTFMWNEIENLQNPFLMVITTIDTHPPYTMTKDLVKFGNGKNDILNAFHTTDDAFKKFWEKFQKSDFYNNTILIVVADHAIFPSDFVERMLGLNNEKLSFYDEIFFAMYIPENILPKEIQVYSSSIDFTPTLLHVLDINGENTFEGYSIFGERVNFPNIISMHDLGLYINQEVGDKRDSRYGISSIMECGDEKIDIEKPLTLCELNEFFKWKRTLLEQGRFFKL